jgi:hypothetical protein
MTNEQLRHVRVLPNRLVVYCTSITKERERESAQSLERRFVSLWRDVIDYVEQEVEDFGVFRKRDD